MPSFGEGFLPSWNISVKAPE